MLSYAVEVFYKQATVTIGIEGLVLVGHVLDSMEPIAYPDLDISFLVGGLSQRSEILSRGRY